MLEHEHCMMQHDGVSGSAPAGVCPVHLCVYLLSVVLNTQPYAHTASVRTSDRGWTLQQGDNRFTKLLV